MLLPFTYFHEPAYCACEAFCEFPEGYCVVRWGLVPGHYLRCPLAVTGPLVTVKRREAADTANLGQIRSYWSRGCFMRTVMRMYAVEP